MRLYLTSVRLGCKRLLYRKGTWLTLLLLPLLCGGLCGFWALEQPMIRVRVGVAFDPGNGFHAALYDTLAAKDTPVEFLAYVPEDREELERLVETGRLECAYLFHDNLTAESVANADQQAITLLKSPQSVLDIYFTELLFSALYEHSALAMDRELLTGLLGMEPEEAERQAQERMDFYNSNPDGLLRPVFQLQTPGGAQFGEASVRASGGRIVHGMVAVFLLIMTAGALPSLIEEKADLLGRLERRRMWSYLLGTGSGLVLVGVALGTMTLLLCAALYPPVLGGLLLELLALTAYQLSLSALGLLAVVLLRRSDTVYGGAVFVVLLTLVMGGVLLDIGDLSAALGGLSRLFLSNYYLGAVLGGGGGALLPLAGVTALALLAALVVVGNSKQGNGMGVKKIRD